MGTSADRDDRDEDEKDKAADEAPPEKKGEKAGPATEGAAKAKAAAGRADEEDEEDEDDEEEEEDDDEEEEAKPAAKSKSKSASKTEEPAPRRPGAKGPGARGPGARSARGPGAVLARPVAANGGGSLGKSVLLFFVIVIGLGAGFAILGREPSAEQSKPKWKEGQVVDVEITLVRSDRQDLTCASAVEIGGKHCAFEATDKPWSKGGNPNDDKQILKPYTTLDRMQFVGAGLWAEPALAADKVPATRFSVKCKYKVEGTLKSVGIRWEQTGQWLANNDWYAGTISNCTLSL